MDRRVILFRLLVFFALLLFATLYFLLYTWEKYNDISTHLAKLVPGMTTNDVDRIIPNFFFDKWFGPFWNSVDMRTEMTSYEKNTYISSTNVVPYLVMGVSGALLNPYEYASIYFDVDCKLVGITPTRIGERNWHPKWGVQLNEVLIANGVWRVPPELMRQRFITDGYTNSAGEPDR